MTSDSKVAWSTLLNVLELLDSNIIYNNDFYIHCTFPTTFPISGLDDVEFLLKDDVILYRSSSRGSLYVYPVTQIVGDKGENSKRVEKVREMCGFIKLEY